MLKKSMTDFLNALNADCRKNILKEENSQNRPSLWVMRQAGRYLPEYRELRAQTPNFMDFCYSPDKACEATLQPLRRFRDFGGLGAAILFSDILTIPHGLGLKVEFVKGDGPQVEKVTSVEQLKGLREALPKVRETLSPVFEAVRLIRKTMDVENFSDTPLIGFCGAPWTVAAYMFDEKPSKDTLNLRTWAYKDPKAFKEVMAILVEASVVYLNAQIEAGAEAIQIFDSWANAVPPELFDMAVQSPLLAICAGVKKEHPDVPIIVFAKGISNRHLKQLVEKGTEPVRVIDGVGISHTQDLAWALDTLLPHVAVQGNLDPAVLLAGPEATKQETQRILKIANGRRGFIFNLGHGITPKTPIESMEVLVQTVTGT